MRESSSLTKPPEGVVAGENVHRDSEPENYEDMLVGDVMGVLKARGEPYISMDRSELRERAVETIDKHGVEL